MAEAVLALLPGVLIGYAIRRILDQYLKLPLILETSLKRRRGQAFDYKGGQAIANYWKDLLGPDFGLETVAKKKLLEHHQVTFHDVVLTDFVPRSPGYYYSKELWEDPRKALISLGVVRFVPTEKTGSKRLLALHRPTEFEAHADIEKGIPIVVPEEVHKEFVGDLEKYGSACVKKITATLSSVGTYSEDLKTAGMASVFPVVKSKRFVTKGKGAPYPLMGNAWVVYGHKKGGKSMAGFLNFRFWTGVEYHGISLQEAKETLDSLIPEGGWPITEFDYKKPKWQNATIQLVERMR